MPKHEMSPEQAQHFDHKSLTSEMILTMVAEAKGCSCRPYVDWYTYRRWQALGYQVQKGEKGTRLTTYIKVTKTDDKGNEKEVTVPRSVSVFCRCQVKPKS